jgi:hypothetical protein
MFDQHSCCSDNAVYKHPNGQLGEVWDKRERRVNRSYRMTMQHLDLILNSNFPGKVCLGEEILNSHGINGFGCAFLIAGKHSNFLSISLYLRAPITAPVVGSL